MTKVQATLHLCAYFIQLLLLLLLLIYPLVVSVSIEYPQFSTIFGIGYLFALTSLAPTIFFVTGSRQGGRNWVRDLPQILAVTAFGAGLMVNTARAALQIFTRKNPSFERTAKFGLEESDESEQSWTLKRYQLAPDRIIFAEIALGLYAAFAAYLAFDNSNWGVFTYATIFGLGLFAVAGATLSHSIVLHRARRQRETAVRTETERLTLSGPTPMAS